jgi:UDPglucose 6-dehydrogenase
MGANTRRVKNICCIGAGYVGGPTCAVIAYKNPQVSVTVVDLSNERISAWKSTTLPIFEPGLYDIVEVARDGTDGRSPNLHFSTDVAGAIRKADLIFIAVNTPTKQFGVGAGSASDLGYVESAARAIAEVATSSKIVVEKSTVPCGTAERLRSIFTALAPTVSFDILSNPEFLAEGSAVNDLLHPDRILIGSHTDERSKAASDALVGVYSWVPPERIVTINLWSSELAKLAANCMLAQRISSINSLSAVCEATGANISEVAFAVGLDHRIGDRMLKASAGFGGSCFKKDVLSLVYIAESLHLPEVAGYWRGVVEMNEWQKSRFSKRITAALHNTLSRKRIAILGWAYKKNTGDTRESAAISIAGQMLAEGAQLSIFDPQVSERQILLDLDLHGSSTERVQIHSNALEACVDACAVVVLTEWDCFRCEDSSSRGAHHTDGTSLPCTWSGSGTATSSDSGIDMHDDEQPFSSSLVNASTSEQPDVANIDWEKIAAVVRRP